AVVVTSLVRGARADGAEARRGKGAEDAAGQAEGPRRAAPGGEASLWLELCPTDLRRAHEAWENGEPDRLRELLDRHRPRDGGPDPRGFAWHYLDTYRPAAERVLAGHEFPLLSADITGDGRLVATSDRGGVVRLWDAASGRELRAGRYAEQEVTCVRFSPDGRTLATCGQDRTIRLFDVATWTETACLRGHGLTVTAVSWSPDGTRLASGGRDNAVKVWDTTTRTEVWSRADHQDVVRCVAWSPDGRVVASAGKDPDVWLWEPDTGVP